jgi:hypothetical protein
VKNKIFKYSIPYVLALAFLALPVVAKADVFTFNAPATTPNNNSNTNNPSQGDYQGGANQFNLDHHLAYTWRLSGVNIPQGHQITSATLTITNIRNWDSNPNTLFIHLLNTAQTYNSSSAGSPTLGWHTQTFNLPGGAVTGYVDVSLNQAPVTSISDAFGAGYATNPLVDGANTIANLFLDAESFTTTATTYTLNFTPEQLAQLAAYIANGSDFAFGFDADCHFWNNGISFTFNTGPSAVPEPATLFLLGSGLVGFGYFQRRRRGRH